MTYWLQGGTYNSTPELMVENRSDGLITNATPFLPIPAQTSAQGCNVQATLRVVVNAGIEMLHGE